MGLASRCVLINRACNVRLAAALKLKVVFRLTLLFLSNQPSKIYPELTLAVSVTLEPPANVPPPVTLPPAVMFRVAVMVKGRRAMGRFSAWGQLRQVRRSLPAAAVVAALVTVQLPKVCPVAGITADSLTTAQTEQRIDLEPF